MSSELPMGWTSRGNALAPESAAQTERVGDWTAHTVAAKYVSAAAVLEDTSSNVPLGWVARSNTKTLEELSTSTSASIVAVAEVHLRDEGSMFGAPRPLAAAITKEPHSSSSSSSSSSSLPPPPTLEQQQQRLEDEEETRRNLSLLPMLASAVLQMSDRLKNIEQQNERLSAEVAELKAKLDAR